MTRGIEIRLAEPGHVVELGPGRVASVRPGEAVIAGRHVYVARPSIEKNKDCKTDG